jgi:sulfonate transport system substrate-binding protein
VLAAYEQARIWAIANPDALRAMLAAATKLPEPVIARQLERTDLSHSAIGETQKATILAAGLALQASGVIKPEVDVPAVVDALVDGRFLSGTR